MSKIVKNVLANDISKAFSFDPGIVPKSVYYPNNIGLPAPAPQNYFELAISGKQNGKREAFPKITKIFEEAGATILSLSFANNQSWDQFIMNVVCDLTNAKCPADELLIRVSKSKHVTIAEKSPQEGKIFGSLSFPLTLFGGEVRTLALDADRMVNLFDHITKECGTKGRETLFEDGRVEGKEIIEAIKEKLGQRSRDKTLVLENARALFQAAGWGRLFIHEDDGSQIYQASVADPPTDADGGKILGNYFLQGMVAGMIEPFIKKENGNVKLSIIKEGYDDERRILILHYMENASIDLSPKGKEEEEDKRVLENVKEIIKSLEQGNDKKGQQENEEKLRAVLPESA
jgi:hypothetical protein